MPRKQWDAENDVTGLQRRPQVPSDGSILPSQPGRRSAPDAVGRRLQRDPRVKHSRKRQKRPFPHDPDTPNQNACETPVHNAPEDLARITL